MLDRGLSDENRAGLRYTLMPAAFRRGECFPAMRAILPAYADFPPPEGNRLRRGE